MSSTYCEDDLKLDVDEVLCDKKIRTNSQPVFHSNANALVLKRDNQLIDGTAGRWQPQKAKAVGYPSSYCSFSDTVTDGSFRRGLKSRELVLKLD